MIDERLWPTSNISRKTNLVWIGTYLFNSNGLLGHFSSDSSKISGMNMKFKIYVKIGRKMWMALTKDYGHDLKFATKEEAQTYLSCVKDQYKPGTKFRIQLA